MAGSDPWQVFHALLRVGDEGANPLPVEQVRRLGNRRRRRRRTVAVVLVLVVTAGGLLGADWFGVGRTPGPATAQTAVPSPTPSTSPAPTASTRSVRTVTGANLPGVSDIPDHGAGAAEEYSRARDRWTR